MNVRELLTILHCADIDDEVFLYGPMGNAHEVEHVEIDEPALEPDDEDLGYHLGIVGLFMGSRIDN